MRILYGVQGTGNGHITRARVMAASLAHYPELQVDFLFSGRKREQLFDMQPFGDFRCFSGLTFTTRNGKVDLVDTIKNAQLAQLYRDIRQLDLSEYDLVLNDFEPISAWAAKRQGKRCIGLSHQSSFRYDVPKQGQDLGSKLLMKLFAPCGEPMGVHWHHFGFPILPPIINVAIPRLQMVADKVVVYLPFESLTSIQAVLGEFQTHHFVIYHPDVVADETFGHLHLRKLSKEGFEADLTSSAAVMANGGFELPSEALFLGKKLLVKPLLGQFEQESNVATLAQMQLASVMHSLDKEKIATWLALPTATPILFPDVADSLCQWLNQGASAPLGQLCSQLWEQVRFPEHAVLPFQS